MAHSLSAKKRIRQTAKRRARNRARKETVKADVKTFLSAVTHGDFKKAGDEFKQVSKRLAQVASKGTIHKNAANRKRSRLAKRLNAAQKAKTGAGTSAKS